MCVPFINTAHLLIMIRTGQDSSILHKYKYQSNRIHFIFVVVYIIYIFIIFCMN